MTVTENIMQCVDCGAASKPGYRRCEKCAVEYLHGTTLGRVKRAPNYDERKQNVREWRKEHKRTPEQVAAAKKEWAERQIARRHAEEKFHNATKTTIGQAFIKAGLIGRE